MSGTVLVTGASGFIAQHIVKLLISKNYNVVGTVRLDAKGEKLRKNTSGGPGTFTYTIVPDIAANGAFDNVFEAYPEISVVLHTASPCFYETTNPKNDLIIPAMEGTKNIMSTIAKTAKAGRSKIRRVVVTSSDAAIYSPDDEQNPELFFDESCWNNMSLEEAERDPVNAYYGSKAFAEKIAWEFAAQPGFPPLSTVNPVYVFGPQAYDNEVAEKLNMSNEVINALLKTGPHGSFSNDKAGFIDVRDVARAHLAAFEQEATVGKRLYMSNGQFSVQMMLDVIHEKFRSLRDRVPVGKPGTGPMDILALARTNNDATRKLLGFEFTPLSTCIEEVVQQILQYQQKQKL
ncbi:NAD(P)-binding protein [Metschnikowia bicuspidata var. bicuspidata NRRL YB-4993]|uniref:NAD(P)-binding protein n=1 Tax=Metschnikowia bicuspidata var. bicuspidata NRRL YB-4993 TaxID=869754 RepID=A0A1A0H514_9ASCO|nr:NAD(P)-binding protein [Metschnikowia bicuspidata var. bicuspidata NRRL YB-4993]OBA19169.1 NAD(P)-binding protein [Metschnikowia bicuspidata var. bicuspidata NRRL YB-4993]